MVAASHDGSDSRDLDGSVPDGAKRTEHVGGHEDIRPFNDGRPNDDLTEARNVLHNVPELSTERMAEIKDRIKRGYYQRTDVLKRIAKRLTDQLSR